MDYRIEQDKFDKVKWYDSILVGYDRCGSYAFCGVCNKEEEQPCARAMHRFYKKRVRIATLRVRWVNK